MTKPIIPNRSRKGVLLKLLASHSSTIPPEDLTHCCICHTGHDIKRWKKCSFILTEFGVKLASLVMESKIEGNCCCNSAYVVLFDYYYSVEGSKKANTLLSLTNVEQPKIKEEQQPTTLQQAQETQRKLNKKEVNELNGEIALQYLNKCGIIIKTKEKQFTNKWYDVVTEKLRDYYNKQRKSKRKKQTFRKKCEYVDYLSTMALEEEQVLWKKGLPLAQSSSQTTYIIEEPLSQ